MRGNEEVGTSSWRNVKWQASYGSDARQFEEGKFSPCVLQTMLSPFNRWTHRCAGEKGVGGRSQWDLFPVPLWVCWHIPPAQLHHSVVSRLRLNLWSLHLVHAHPCSACAHIPVKRCCSCPFPLPSSHQCTTGMPHTLHCCYDSDICKATRINFDTWWGLQCWQIDGVINSFLKGMYSESPLSFS